MAGRVVVSTLNNDTGVLATQNGMNGIAKAWGSYAYVGNGSTPTLNSAFNISSITRNSAGNYTFAFTTAMPNANYAFTYSSGIYTVGNDSVVLNVKAKSTNSITVLIGYTSGGSIVAFDYGIDFNVSSS
jgi:hypothetical protein